MLAVTAISLAIQICVVFFRGRFWQLRERLEAAIASNTGISVTAVIPARDEAALIARTVSSLRAQNFTGQLKIIVADDQSTDATAAAARAAGADLIVPVDPRPSEWKGKLWAVASGIRAGNTAPEFFLLTDADIEYGSSSAIASLMEKAESGYDLVSVMVHLRAQSPAEKLLIPAFVYFFFKLYPPAWVASNGRTAAAAGGCMLIRREILERIGGIESIRTALIDDCALARRVKTAGGRVWLGTSPLDIRSIREYRYASDIRAMIARSAFAQLNHSAVLLAGTVVGMAIIYLVPVLALFTGNALVMTLGAAAGLSARSFLCRWCGSIAFPGGPGSVCPRSHCSTQPPPSNPHSVTGAAGAGNGRAGFRTRFNDQTANFATRGLTRATGPAVRFHLSAARPCGSAGRRDDGRTQIDYGVGFELLDDEEFVFERTTRPCFRLVLVVDDEFWVCEPYGVAWVALVCVSVVVWWPSLVVVVLVLFVDSVDDCAYAGTIIAAANKEVNISAFIARVLLQFLSAIRWPRGEKLYAVLCRATPPCPAQSRATAEQST
jgi:hopene-associated glycosyltransferase HpnB